MSDYRTTFSDRGGSFNTNFNDGNRFKTSFKEGGGLVGGQILVNTTEGWNSQRDLRSKPKTIYVYSDHEQVEEDGVVKNVPGFKVGDGNAYLIDLAFSDAKEVEHMANTDIHVTLQEKEFWNNKVRCIVDGTNLNFTTN